MNRTYHWLSNNRPKSPLTPQGIVIHSTAGIGAPAQNIVNWFDNPKAQSSAHGVVDWDKYIQCIPYNEVAWHAGPTANSRYIGIEMCETNSSIEFKKVWDNTVELCAEICTTYGFDPKTQILSHHEVSLKWKEVDHIDPDHYFKNFTGYDMTRLKKDISEALAKDSISEEDLQKLANKVAKVDANNKILFNYFNQIKDIADKSKSQLYLTIKEAPTFAKSALNYFVNNKFLAIEKVGDAFQFNPPLTYDTVRALTIAYNIIQGKGGEIN